jgi:NADH-quinone oxidoreductase subunit M
MAAMAGCGLPGFANFVGEVSVFFGAWRVFPEVTVLAVWGGLMIGGIYMTRAIRNVLHGPVPDKLSTLPDAGLWRKFPYALLLASLFLFGCFPKLLISQIEPDVAKIVVNYPSQGIPPMDVEKTPVNTASIGGHGGAIANQ